MIDIVVDYIPEGRKNRPGLSMTPRYITIHDTSNPNKGADALSHSKYLKSSTAENIPVSWHFTVDDNRIVQHLPLNENGWHATDGHYGPGNRMSIGIEICMNVDGDRRKAEENAAQLVAKLLNDYELLVDSVVQHNRWYPKKNCPIILRSKPNGWENFLRKVETYIKYNSNEIDYLKKRLEAVTAENNQLRSLLKQIQSLTKKGLDV